MILIVYAHHDPSSFNHALLETARNTLEAAGHEVEVSDLYAMGFQAAAGRADFKDMRDATRFGYAREQFYASRTDGFAEDIAAEIDKLRRCEFLILQFPLWWFSMPAIMKGWVDRVFANGAIYNGSTAQFFERGFMTGKRAMVSVTQGAPGVMFEPAGMCGAIEAALWPIHNGILRFVGFDVLPPFVCPGVDIADHDTLSGMLDKFAARVRGFRGAEPMYFHPWSDYGSDLLLKPGLPARTIGQRARDVAPVVEVAEVVAPEVEEEMTAFMTVVLTVTDTSWIGEYVKHVKPLMDKYGAKPVTVSGPVEVLEGEEQPSQIALFAFPSTEAIKAFMDDPEYLPWKEARKAGSTGAIYAFNAMT